MATKGTPYQGRDLIIGPRVYVPSAGLQSLSVVAYCNLANSLSDLSVYSDLVQPTGTGYAPVTLGNGWTAANGVNTYNHGVTGFPSQTLPGVYDPYWQNTHATLNWSQAVTGIAMVGTVGGSGPYLLHFMDLSAGSLTMTPLQRLVANLSTLTAP